MDRFNANLIGSIKTDKWGIDKDNIKWISIELLKKFNSLQPSSMKIPPNKNPSKLQNLLLQQQVLQTDIKHIQKQIQQLEVHYLEKSWPDGNIYIGWNKNLVSSQITNNKVSISAKQKMFSLSSATSQVQHQVQNIADKNISPWGQNRFQSMRKKHKHYKQNQVRRAKSLRNKKKR